MQSSCLGSTVFGSSVYCDYLNKYFQMSYVLFKSTLRKH